MKEIHLHESFLNVITIERNLFGPYKMQKKKKNQKHDFLVFKNQKLGTNNIQRQITGSL